MREERSPACELLTDLADKVSFAAQQSLGVDDQSAAQFGKAVATEMAENWGGQNLYFPKGIVFQITERNSHIYDEFDGSNVAMLSRKYKLTRQAIYQIIRQERQKRLA